MIAQDFQKQVKGYGLTTANILYRRPDHPWLLQTYVWQNYDLCPDFPELQCFFGILAEISRRCPAFGHGRAFPPHQTRRDQSSGWCFQSPLTGGRYLVGRTGVPVERNQRWSRFPEQNGGLAKVDSGFDYAANFSSFACVA